MLDLAYSIADQNTATSKSIGIYNISLQLARSLATHPEIERLTVFSNHTIPLRLNLPPKMRVEEHNFPIANKAARILWDQWGVYRCARATGHQWLFLPKGFCSFVARPPLRIAAYVHDIVDDVYSRQYPGFQPELEMRYFALSRAATIRRANLIFTNTEFSKSEIARLCRRDGLPEPKIIVAGYGFDNSEVKGHVEKQDRVLLFASKWPHKRTDIALRFLEHWRQKSNFSGVIDCIGIFSASMEKPVGPQWNWIGRVPVAQRCEMIRRARAVIYVSGYEGFGLPPVEAILEGTCPVFSDLPPLREVMGDCGCPFSNESKESFVQAMNRAFTVSGETIRAWADALRERHNWPTVTEKIVRELLAA